MKKTLINVALFSALLLIVNSQKVDFDSSLFIEAPQVNYPTGVMVAPDGKAIYISSDKNSSLSVGKNNGRVFKILDSNLDGKVDGVTLFIENIDSPRNGFFIDNKLYLIHPPYLSVYEDTTGDGKADKSKILVKGLGFDLNFRGADHTTNGARMAIDGWIYIAVGDYGMPAATGTDGSQITLQGGGLVRVRPDGSELEIYTKHVRNIYDVATSPTLDFFARDNTNDGLGWNTRFHHLLPLANAGYPRLYKFFATEALDPLADYGGGSGTGMLYFQDPNWDFPNNEVLLSADFTTRKIYYHPLTPKGASYSIEQKLFFEQSIRMIDMDIDGLGNLYLSNWKNGTYRYTDENVGQIFRLTPKNAKKSSFPELKKHSPKELIKLLFCRSSVTRLSAQQELLKRSKNNEIFNLLLAEIKNKKNDLYGRIAAIFTFKQIFGNDANQPLGNLLADKTIKSYLLKAIIDRKTQLQDINPKWYAEGLHDDNDKVKLEAINGLVRLQNSMFNDEIIAITKNFTLPYLVSKQFKTPNYKEKFSNKSFSKKISIDVKNNKKIYLRVQKTSSSDLPFVWGEPHFLTNDGQTIKIDTNLIIHQEGNFKQDDLPIYLTKKPKQAKYGFATKNSLFLEILVPQNALSFEVILGASYVFKNNYGFNVSLGINNPKLEKKSTNTPLQHIAIQALSQLKDSYQNSLNLLEKDGYTDATITALFLAPHSKEVIDAIKHKLQIVINEETKGQLIQVLARLYHIEEKWSLKTWWSTRPDHRGPYFTPVKWSESDRIQQLIEKNFKELTNKNLKLSLIKRIRANRINPSLFNLDFKEELVTELINANQLNSEDIKKILKEANKDSNKDKLIRIYDSLEKAQTISDNQLIGIRLQLLSLMDNFKINKKNSDIKRQNFIYSTAHLSKEELLKKATKALMAKQVDPKNSYLWKHIINLVVAPLSPEKTRLYLLKNIIKLINLKNSAKAGFNQILDAIIFIKATDFLTALKKIKESKNKKISLTIASLSNIQSNNINSGKLVGLSKTNEVMQWINQIKANQAEGKKYILQTGCIACHTFTSTEEPKGPYLGSIGAKFSQQYIIESILEPVKQVAQGFLTKEITLKDGTSYIGFNTKTTDKYFTIRTIFGQTTKIAISDIKGGLKNGIKEIKGSQMPAGLTAGLTRQQFANFIAYLQSLKSH